MSTIKIKIVSFPTVIWFGAKSHGEKGTGRKGVAIYQISIFLLFYLLKFLSLAWWCCGSSARPPG
jgi:hypothetical protein